MVIDVERLGGNRILNGYIDRRKLEVFVATRRAIHVPIHGNVFVQTPRGGDVINHDVADRIAAERIVAVRGLGLAAAKTHVTDDHVVGIELDRVACDANAIARRGVTSDRDVRRADADRGFQSDDAGDIEHHDARSALFDRVTKTSGPAVIQIRDDNYFSAASAEGIHAAAPRTGERGD